MARSSGARPRKAQREEVARLKAELGTVRRGEWARAQLIFGKICVLCGVIGPSGQMMTPRSCRVCGYYGHTAQYCPVDLQRVRRASDALQWTPTTPEEIAWAEELKAIDARVAEGKARWTCEYVDQREPATEAWQLTNDCTCASCLAYRTFIRSC
tara:strand:+ start:487 stop:951 length:465 start_codon:yes stop_codon:yes gene_type:complete